MSNTKFNEFSYEGSLVQLSDALTEDGTLMDNYDRYSLYCPYCESVRLKFYSRTFQKNAYLATWPDSKHAEYCPASFAPAKKAEDVGYYRELSEEQIQDKLNAVLRSLTKNDNEQSHSTQSKLVRVANDTTSSSTPTYARYLPRHSFYRLYDIEPELKGIPVAFYGEAYVEFVPEWNSNLNQIHLKHKSSKKLFLYMKNGETDKFTQKVDANTLYTVVFIGIINPSGKFPELVKPGAFIIKLAD